MENVVVDINLLEHLHSNKLLDTNDYETHVSFLKKNLPNCDRARKLIKLLLVKMRKYAERVKQHQQGAAAASTQSQALPDEEDPYDIFMRTLSEMGPSTSFIPLFMNTQINVRVNDVFLFNHLFEANSRFSSKKIDRFRQSTAHNDLVLSNTADAALNSLVAAPSSTLSSQEADSRSRGFSHSTESASASSSTAFLSNTGPSTERTRSTAATATTRPKERRRDIPHRFPLPDELTPSSYHPHAFRRGLGRADAFGAFGDAGARSSSASRRLRGPVRGLTIEPFGMPAYPMRSPGAPKPTSAFTFDDEAATTSSGDRTPDYPPADVEAEEDDDTSASANTSVIARKRQLVHRRQGSDGRALEVATSTDELFAPTSSQLHPHPAPNADQLRRQRALLYAPFTGFHTHRVT